MGKHRILKCIVILCILIFTIIGIVKINGNYNTSCYSYKDNKDGTITVKYNGEEIPGIVTVAHGNKVYKHYIYDREYNIIGLTDGYGIYEVRMYEKKDSEYKIDNDNNIKEIRLNKETSNELNAFKCSTLEVKYSNAKEDIENIISNCNGIDDEATIQNIYEYVCSFKYDEDIMSDVRDKVTESYVSDLKQVINNKSGICIDKSSLVVACARKMGCTARMVYGYYNNEETLHAWAEVQINNEWIVYDATKGKTGIYKNNDIYKAKYYY